jgi:hypothetical protein
MREVCFYILLEEIVKALDRPQARMCEAIIDYCSNTKDVGIFVNGKFLPQKLGRNVSRCTVNCGQNFLYLISRFSLFLELLILDDSSLNFKLEIVRKTEVY